jgi:peptidoglycan LD-endopeptidase CwlK
MMANNTSGFNYRMIAGTERLSNHARGRAIDINPLLNPCIRGDFVQPAGAAYDPSRPGTLTTDSPVTQFLKARGWIWGGDWASGRDGKPLKDYQHFEKPE